MYKPFKLEAPPGNTKMKLALGTVQFGTPYGPANPATPTARVQAHDILRLAARSGVSLLDTAPTYGNAEEVIGELQGNCTDFDVVTKTEIGQWSSVTPAMIDFLSAGLQRSAAKLGQRPLYGVLFHRASDLLLPGKRRLFDEIQRWKTSGMVRKVGVSVYSPGELEKIVNVYQPDIVQFPMNVFDRRFETSGLLEDLAQSGVELHVRSAFLQGLVLNDSRNFDIDLAPESRIQLQSYLDSVPDAMEGRIAAALSCIRKCNAVSHIIVGVYSIHQMMELLNAWRANPKYPSEFDKFVTEDENLINPMRWLPQFTRGNA